MIFVILMCILGCVLTQELEQNELADTLLTLEDIPIRQHPAQFQFIKDRAPSAVSRRIIGGNVAKAHEYPFQVALYIYVQITLYFCGGSLITPQWVLTAAHCVNHATSITVMLGSHDLTVNEASRIVYNTTSYVVHEDWDLSVIQYDVALVRLPKPVEFNEYINKVPIALERGNYSGQMSRCLGWGRTTLGYLSNVLRYVDSELISKELCNSYEDYRGFIVDQHLCTSGEGFVGTCNGDSGGPLVINGVQVGIVSFGYNDCKAGYPSVYARVSEFYKWINETIGNYTEDSGAPTKESLCHILVVLGFVMTFYL